MTKYKLITFHLRYAEYENENRMILKEEEFKKYSNEELISFFYHGDHTIKLDNECGNFRLYWVYNMEALAEIYSVNDITEDEIKILSKYRAAIYFEKIKQQKEVA